MPNRINVLDKNTINRIAAGEVIDRPASIIKELIENSIDAGSTSISVEIRGGGIELIRITDNGCGIDRDDVRVAFVRHTTSKIKNAEDLSFITSLGFRGEALASIAAVADVELITKTKEAFSAVRFHISGGEELEYEEIGAPDGTTFIIRDVFGCVPVRRKFLKSSATEGSYCNEAVERIALSHPEVSIKYVNNGRNVLYTNGSGKLKDVLFGIYGRDVASEIAELNFTGSRGISISGCICKPTIVRNNRNTENTFVNGRFIKSPIIFKAIEDAYQPYLMQHKYPFTAIYITVDPASMDVNVHPTKQEVRFENPEAVYNTVFEAVTEVLAGKALIHRAEREAALAGNEKNKSSYIPEPFEKRLKSDNNSFPVVNESEGIYKNDNSVSGSRGIQRIEIKNIKSDVVNQNNGGEILRIEGEGIKSDSANPKSESAVFESENSKSESAGLGTGSVVSWNENSKSEDEGLRYGNTISGHENLKSENEGLRPENAVFGSESTESENFSPRFDGERFESESPKIDIADQKYGSEVQKDNISSGINSEPQKYDSKIQVSDGLAKSDFESEKTDTSGDKAEQYKQGNLFDNAVHLENRQEFNSVFSKGYRIVGQIFETYWIVECNGCVYLIDQHAAHEKILYEKFMEKVGTEDSTQILSPPIIISLSSIEEETAERYADELGKNGFVLEHFGGHEYALSEIPLNLYGLSPKNFLLELLDELRDDIKGNVIKSIKEKIATCACKAAVKGNMALSEAEARELLKKLLSAENPFNCPHGRPIIIDVTKKEIEKKFKRIL